MTSILKLKAKAIVATRLRKEAREALVDEVRNGITLPTPEAGRDGRDAPTLEEILSSIAPMLPTPKIESNTIVQKIDEGDLSGMVQEMLDAKIPEIEKQFRPKVELIREDVSDEKLEGFVSKKDFDEALKRIQRAITAHSGGGTPPTPIEKVKIIDSDYQIIRGDQNIKGINTVAIDVTLPPHPEIGEVYSIKRSDAEITVWGTIDGDPCKIINVIDYALKVIYDGTEWIEV